MGLRIMLCGVAVLLLMAVPSGPSREARRSKEATLTIIGTVVYIELEGGFYGIVANSGERYFPLNLNQQYKVNDLKVRIEGRSGRTS